MSTLATRSSFRYVVYAITSLARTRSCTAFSHMWQATIQINWNKTRKKSSKPTRLVWETNMAAVSFFLGPQYSGRLKRYVKTPNRTTKENMTAYWDRITLLITSFPSVANTVARFPALSTRFSAPVNIAVCFPTLVTMATCMFSRPCHHNYLSCC